MYKDYKSVFYDEIKYKEIKLILIFLLEKSINDINIIDNVVLIYNNNKNIKEFFESIRFNEKCKKLNFLYG